MVLDFSWFDWVSAGVGFTGGLTIALIVMLTVHKFVDQVLMKDIYHD